MHDELSVAKRWKERRDHFIGLGVHPSVAGALAWEWLDSPSESLTDAARSIVETAEVPRATAKRRAGRRRDP